MGFADNLKTKTEKFHKKMHIFLIVYCRIKKFLYICIKKQVQHLLKQHIMETYKFKFGSVRVIDCANEAVDFRICEVFNNNGKKINEIRTTKKGKSAASLAMNDTIHWRML